MRISDWSSDVCSSDLVRWPLLRPGAAQCSIRGGGASVDLVKAGMLALLLAADAARPAHACDLQRWQPPIAEAARRYALPDNWLRAVMRAESAGCTELDGRPITSPAGAMGLMQVMPVTWARSEAHTSELQSLMRHSYAALCM